MTNELWSNQEVLDEILDYYRRLKQFEKFTLDNDEFIYSDTTLALYRGQRIAVCDIVYRLGYEFVLEGGEWQLAKKVVHKPFAGKFGG